MKQKLKQYLVLFLFNTGLLVISFFVYSILSKSEQSLSLNASALAYMVFVLLYAVVYGITSCLYVKSIIFSQLLFFCFAFFMPICFGTFDFVKFDASEITGRLEYLRIVVLFSLIPALITKLIVTIIERKKKKDILERSNQP